MGSNKKAANWELAARRVRVGKRHNLESLENNHYFHPLKYSVDGVDEINAAMMERKDVLEVGALAKMKHLAAKGNIKSPEDIFEKLSDEEFGAVIKATDVSALKKGPLIRAKIKHGFGPNNFGGVDKDGALNKPLPEEFLDSLLQNEDVVLEILKVVERHNHPLSPAGTSSK